MTRLALVGKKYWEDEHKGGSLVFGEHGTHFNFREITFMAFNPFKSYKGTYNKKFNSFKDQKQYTFNPSELWYVADIFPDWETDGRLHGGGGHRIAPFLYLMGLDSKPSKNLNRTIVKLQRTQPYNTELGIVNHISLQGRRRNTLEYQMQGITTVNMTWEAFNSSIKNVIEPDNIYLPIGTILKINDKADWSSDGKLKDGLKNWLEEKKGSHYVVKNYPVKAWMGYLPNRKTADIYPYYKKKVGKVKLPRKRKPPFDEKRTQMIKSPLRAGGVQHYELHETLKNNTSALKKRGDYDWEPDAKYVHYMLNKGYLMVDGRYGGKQELKEYWLSNKNKLRGGHKFTYTEQVPTLFSLQPSL
jgi:hypothetical protein